MAKQSPKEYPPEKCLYCGRPTRCRDYVINPKAKAGRELPCCSEECFEKTRRFVDWDNKTRTGLYLLLLVLVVANLFFFGFRPDTRWQYLPMLGIGLCILWLPSVFARYERYQALGIRKTKVIIRILAAALAVFAALLMLLY